MPLESRKKTLQFRVTKSERATIEEQAMKLDLKPSEYVRLCVLNDIENRKSKGQAA